MSGQPKAALNNVPGGTPATTKRSVWKAMAEASDAYKFDPAAYKKEWKVEENVRLHHELDLKK